MNLAHAVTILQLQENLDKKEMPEEWMWALDWEMERHLHQVAEKRRAKYGKDDDDDDDDYEDQGVENDLVPKEWRD